jgi:Domain of unknown function (DUF4157)
MEGFVGQTNQAKESTQSAKKLIDAKHTAQSKGPLGETLGPQSLQAALTDPRSISPQQVLQLQHQYGNRAAQRMIQRAQATAHSHASIGAEGGQVESGLQRQIDSARGGGQALDKGVGVRMGSALGADLSGVRVHTDPHSDSINRSLGAEAATVGNDIFFSAGSYSPASSGGQKLLAHELTHVVQQGGAKANKVQTKLTVGPAGDHYEQEAETVANKTALWKSSPQTEGQPSPVDKSQPSLTPALHLSQVNRRLQRLLVKVTNLPAQTGDKVKQVTEKSFKLGPISSQKTSSKSVHIYKDAKAGNILEVGKPQKIGGHKFYQVKGKQTAKGKNVYLREDWVTATLSPNFDKAKAQKGKDEGPESDALGGGSEMLGAAGEYMFQNAEWNEHLKTEKERQEWLAEHPNGADTTPEATDTTPEATGTTPEAMDATPEATDTTTETTDAAPEGGGTTAEGGEAEADKAAWEKSEYTYAQDSMYTASDLVGFAAGAKKIWDIYHDKDMSTWDKVLGFTEAGAGMGAKATDIGYRGEEIKNKVHDSGPSTFSDTTGQTEGADHLLAGFGGASGALTAVVSGMKIIRNTTKVVKMVASDEKYSREEYAEKAGSLLVDAGQLALGVVNTIKVIHYALGGGTMLMSAVPILGIIINGCKVIMDGYYLTQSAINWNKMSKKRGKLKDDLAKTKVTEPLPKSKAKADREAYDTEFSGYRKQVTADSETYRKLEAKKVNFEKHGKKVPGADADLGGTHYSRDELAEYRLAKELRDVNRKRVVRQSIHILTALAQIAGDAMVLGGITGGGGAGLKAGALAVDASLPLVREAKQYTRNKAAEHQAKDKGMLKNAKFVSASKSTAAKMSARRRYAIQLIEMGANLEIKDGKLANPKSPQVKTIKLYLKASGVSTQKLARNAGDPEKQVRVLVKALSKREFLE